MDTTVVVLDPVFLSALLSPLIPAIVALITKWSASPGTKANIATLLAMVLAAVTTWIKLGAISDWKTLAVAFAVAFGGQRVTFSQVYKPNAIPEKFPKQGLIG